MVGVKYLGTEQSEAVGNYVVYRVESGTYDFTVDQMPRIEFPKPLYKGANRSRIGRMNASSMFIETEKLPGFEAFKANDGNPDTCWQAGGVKDQWLEVEWVKPQTFSKVVINEVGNEIKRYKVQAWGGNGWQDLAVGETCGSEKTHAFDAVTASQCRIFIIDASKAASISEFGIF
ncbi:discoidin domain-containing protein [Pontiella desulfatans]